MRLDHIAYRVKNKKETAQFFIDAFGYSIQEEFEIFFNEEKTDVALCLALEPPEKVSSRLPFIVHHIGWEGETNYHLAPEIFVSEGSPNSIVDLWVKARNNVGGIHHLAYMVDSVLATQQEWMNKGWANFSSQEPFRCDDLTQIFTTAHQLTGVTYEFIERKGSGFCKENVKHLMQASTLDGNMRE